MTSLNSRIKSSYVQLGESFVMKQSKGGAGSAQENLTPEQNEFNKSLEELISEASARGKQIIKEAEEKAVEILKQASEAAAAKSAEVEALQNQALENGYAEGYQRGYDDGINEAKREINETMKALGALAGSAFRVKKEIIDSAENEMIELSTLVAEKIIRQHLEVRPEAMQEIIKGAIDQLKDKEEIKIIVNPKVTQNLYEFVEGLKETVKGLKNIRIVEDRTIPQDGVIVESPESRIDARLETQIRELTRALTQEFNEKSHTEMIPVEIEGMIEEKMQEQDEPE